MYFKMNLKFKSQAWYDFCFISLVHKINEGDRPKDDFSIDASYEFASFVLKVGKGVRLTHVSEICIISNSECATYPRFFHPCVSQY